MAFFLQNSDQCGYPYNKNELALFHFDIHYFEWGLTAGRQAKYEKWANNLIYIPIYGGIRVNPIQKITHLHNQTTA